MKKKINRDGEQGKPSLISCASPLMSFLLEDSEEENIVSTDPISQAMKGDKFKANNLQMETDKLQLAELELESGPEINTAHSGEASALNQAAHLQGPSIDALRNTESTLLSLLKLRISPSPELKKKNTRGSCKGLTRKTPKT